MKYLIAAPVAVVMFLNSVTPALAENCGWVSCSATGGGVKLESQDVREAKESAEHQQVGGRPGEGGGGVRDGATWDLTLTPGCPSNDPNMAGEGAYDGACVFMTSFCALHGRPEASSLLWVWRRPAGSQDRWVRSASLCRVANEPSAAVPTVVRPVITAGLVQRAFRKLRFAPATVRIQPEGQLTLVNLETFYRVIWAEGGFEPSEIATVTLLGRQVRFRPQVERVSYQFGDGRGLGPTADMGGIYPDGGVRHTYHHSGSVRVSATATYTGQYSLSGGPWRAVDIEVPVAGVPTPVQVKEARNRLVGGQRQ